MYNKDVINQLIYSKNTASMLLGCLLQNTHLVKSSQYPLTEEDFVGEIFQKCMFKTIKWLGEKGFQTVGAVDIGGVAEQNEELKEILEDNDYIGFCSMAVELSNVDNFEAYYNEIRRLSCIRDIALIDKKDISELYDIDNQKDLTFGLTAEDILDKVYANQFELKNKYTQKNDEEFKQAGVDGERVLESFKNKEHEGVAFESKYLTTLWGTFRKKQLYIRSGDTSSGKSRSACGDLACACSPYLYDEDKNMFVPNPNGSNRGLYIGCEMDTDTEVDPLFWSYIANVSSANVTNYRFEADEHSRVMEVIDMLSNNPCIWLAKMPSFNIQRLEEVIKEYKIKHNIDYVAFDYIMLNTAVTKEFIKNRGGLKSARGDEILLEISKALKDLAEKYDVGIITATQVNSDIKDYRIRDYQVLRGGKAMADKATGGSISMPITKEELELVKPYLNQSHLNPKTMTYIEPNFVETVYKSRFSEFPKECKIFSYYDLGTMRKKELFVTNKNFEPVPDIRPTIVNRVVE